MCHPQNVVLGVEGDHQGLAVCAHSRTLPCTQEDVSHRSGKSQVPFTTQGYSVSQTGRNTVYPRMFQDNCNSPTYLCSLPSRERGHDAQLSDCGFLPALKPGADRLSKQSRELESSSTTFLGVQLSFPYFTKNLA